MSARSKIVRDFSGQEVAIPYDPRYDGKHTPGPWYTAWAISTEHGPVCNIRTGKQGMGPTVALVYGDEANAPDKPITYEQAQANAALIATAPETAAERDRLRQVNEVMVEALKGVIGYLGEGSEHPDPCSTNPTWLSGADVEGPCDCYVGRVVAAIHAAEGRADLGVEPVERPVCTCPFASEGYLSKNCALHAAEGPGDTQS